MKHLTLLLAAAVFAVPAQASAQHSSHDADPTNPTNHDADHHREGTAQPAPPAAEPHSGHHIGPEAGSDPHAGHTMKAAASSPPLAGPPPEAFSGPEHAANAYFGNTAMSLARRDMTRAHGALPAYRVLIDRAEARFGNGADTYALDAQAWYGGDIDKLWIKGEAEGAFQGDLDTVEIQALWSHAISPWFDLQTGVRYDVREGEDRGYLALGVQGLAPYWIEVDAAAFLSDRGDLTARMEAEHDTRITQRLILQPRAEVELALQDVPELSLGSGVASASIGARLRYEITPLFAPYVGIEYDRTFGDTRRMRKMAGEDAGGASLLLGIRTWF